TAPRTPGVWASLSFRLSIPTAIRADFWRAAPAVVAGWATGGLFLSLGANIVHNELGGDAHLWQGLAVAMLAGVGAITAFVMRRRSPRTLVVFGTAALAVGTALSLIALGIGSLPFYLAATAVTGMGFGTGFSGVVASLAPRSVGLQRLARPYLLDLYETTGYAAHLAIREGRELVSIERLQSPRRPVRRPLTGGRYPLHATAIGLVLLAHAPDDVRAEVLAAPLPAYTARTYTDPVQLERLLGDIRRTGYAVSDRQVDDIHVGVAAPVHGADGSVVAAVSLALTEQDVDGKNMIHLVRLTATSISRTLTAAGYGRPDA
ncbi:MAG: hypothetical protein NT132_12330, partial [Microbacterium sp.]|uniref:IclR family transcriptional regulator domain-containing protein n=1 Tax=Microbacterium sp. TaxID=51671 RepID=UPI002605EA38